MAPIEAEMTKDVGNNNIHAVDIDKWAGSLARMLEEVPQYMCRPGYPGRVSRIPETLREVDKSAYEPYLVSIGPYHRGNPRVEQIEKRKWLVLKCVLKQIPELTLEDYLEEIKRIEPRARSFYSDVEMDSESFVQMLLLDGLYIVAMFCGIAKDWERENQTSTTTRNREDKDDVNEINEGILTENDIKNKQMMERDESNYHMGNRNEHVHRTQPTEEWDRWFRSFFARDMFLVENQLPFFVLEKIYHLVYGGSKTELMDTMKVKVGIMLSAYTTIDSEIAILPTLEVHHLLHLCHMFFRPMVQQESISLQFPETNQMFRLGSVSQLYEEGVKFEARSCSTRHSLLDITFDRSGKLVIPCLHVDDDTISLIRNLIALEQMKYPTLGLDVSAYAVLLLHLVTSPKDVEILRRKGILQHHLPSDKDMVYLVNQLSAGLAFDYVDDKYSLKHVFREIKNYSERRVPHWRAWIKHRHCSNPWTAISLLAASLLLLLSVLQTYYAVCSYYYPRFDGHP